MSELGDDIKKTLSRKIINVEIKGYKEWKEEDRKIFKEYKKKLKEIRGESNT